MAPQTQVQAPVRSLDQRMEALKRANDIRVKRAQLKKDLKSGSVSIEQILSEPPEFVSTAKVFDMLMAVPKFGRVKAARLLNQCRISQSKTVGGLCDRPRHELIDLFTHRGAHGGRREARLRGHRTVRRGQGHADRARAAAIP